MLNSKQNILFLLFIIISVPFISIAQESGVTPEKSIETGEQTEATTSEIPTIQDGELKLLLDKIEVIGELEKPQAVFIIPGVNPEIDDIRIKRSFFNSIFRNVERKGRIISKIQTQPTQDRKDYIPW